MAESCAGLFQSSRSHAEEPLGPWLTGRGLNPGADYKDFVVETKILPSQEWDHATLVGIPNHAMTLELIEVPGDETPVQRSNPLSPKPIGRPAAEAFAKRLMAMNRIPETGIESAVRCCESVLPRFWIWGVAQ